MNARRGPGGVGDGLHAGAARTFWTDQRPVFLGERGIQVKPKRVSICAKFGYLETSGDDHLLSTAVNRRHQQAR